MMKNTQYYLSLPYTCVLRRDEEGDYVAHIDELPGCSAHGKTPHEALDNLEESKKLWILDCIEGGDPVPEPAVQEPLPSGKWVQRVPRSLHKRLASLAKKEGVSLNQFVTSLLAEAAGVRAAQPREVEEDAWLAVHTSGKLMVHCWSLPGGGALIPQTRCQYADVLRRFQAKVAQPATRSSKAENHAHKETCEVFG